MFQLLAEMSWPDAIAFSVMMIVGGAVLIYMIKEN